MLITPPSHLIVGGAPAYIAQPVHFDGVVDYMKRGATLTGAADSKLISLSFWYNGTGGDGAYQVICDSVTALNGGTRVFEVGKGTTNRFLFACANTAGTGTAMSLGSTAGTVMSGSGWRHYCGSCDLTNVAKRHSYVDDVSDLVVATYIDTNMDFTSLDWGVGGNPDAVAGTFMRGDLADVWIAPGVYIDFSVTAERRKFISASGKPVYLGANGELPTGSSPLVFMSATTVGDVSDWHTNKGTGGGFTKGAGSTLTTSPTSPSTGYVAPTYSAVAVTFDGTNDVLKRGAGLTGAADSKMFTLSCWVRLNSLAAWGKIFASATTAGGSTLRHQFHFDLEGNNFQAVITNTTPAEGLNVSSSVTLSTSTWYHILLSVDMNSTSNRYLYINDADGSPSWNTYLNVNLDNTVGDWSVGATPASSDKINADIADLWFDDGVYIDLSVQANRRKFIDANGKPANLGEYGELPNGTQPIVFLRNALASWHTNQGSGGGFTVTGALTTASSSPSD